MNTMHPLHHLKPTHPPKRPQKYRSKALFLAKRRLVGSKLPPNG